MAPKKGTKRPAPATRAEPSPKKASPEAKKKAKGEPMYTRIVETIEMADFLPDGCRSMLSAMVPACFGVAKEERLETLEMGMKMIGEVVENVKAAKQEALDAATAIVTELEASKSGLGAAAENARSCVTDAAAKAAAQKAVLAECDATAKAAVEAHAEKLREQKAGDALAEKLAGDKVKFQSALVEEFANLSEGMSAAEAKKCLNKLMPLIGSLGLDQSLMTVGPSALQKQPSERGPFDTIVLEQLAKGLNDHVASLAKQLEEAAPTNVQRAADTATAQAALEAAKATQNAAEAEATAAQQVEKEARDTLRAAEASLHDFEPRMKKAVHDRDTKAAALTEYVGNHMECFAALRDKSNAQTIIDKAQATAIEGGDFGCEGAKAGA